MELPNENGVDVGAGLLAVAAELEPNWKVLAPEDGAVLAELPKLKPPVGADVEVDPWAGFDDVPNVKDIVQQRFAPMMLVLENRLYSFKFDFVEGHVDKYAPTKQANYILFYFYCRDSTLCR